jgi:hypothetical protein
MGSRRPPPWRATASTSAPASGSPPCPAPPATVRLRHLTIALPTHHAARLLDVQSAGAGEQQLRALAAEGLGEMYFRDCGSRAHGLAVEFADVEHIRFDLWAVSTA